MPPTAFVSRALRQMLDFCQHFSGADGTALGLESSLRNEPPFVDNSTLNSGWSAGMWNGNRTTGDYWTAGSGSMNAVYDLGAPFAIDHINWLLYYGDTRTYLNIGVEGSLDNVSWTTIRSPANFQPSTLGATGLDIAVGATYRYLRLHGEGNTVSAGNDWVELEVYVSHLATSWVEQSGTWRNQSGAGQLTSLAAEGTVNVMRTIDNVALNPSLPAGFYNGNRSTSDWTNLGGGTQTRTIDLGAQYAIASVDWLFYYGDTRTYASVSLEGSTNGTSWTTIRAAATWQPSTTGSAGLDITVGATYRYLRFSSGGNSLNGNNEWVEIEVNAAINVPPFGRTGVAFVRYPVATAGIDLSVEWTGLLSASRSVILAYDQLSDTGFALDYDGGTTVTLVKFFAGASTTLGTATVPTFSAAGWEIVFSPSGSSVIVKQNGVAIITATGIGAATATSTDAFSSAIAAPWTALNTGTWTTTGGQAKCAGATGGGSAAGFGLLVREQNVQVADVQVDFAAMSGGSPYTGSTGLVWNVVDGSNFYMWHSNYGSSSLYRVVGGVLYGQGSLFAAGTGTYRIVHTSDGLLKMYLNGVLQSTNAGMPLFAAGTKVGIASNDTADVARFDNWTSTYPTLPFGKDAGVASDTANADSWDEFCWSVAA